MAKGKSRCFFCNCELNPRNKTSFSRTGRYLRGPVYVDCCHKCKDKEEKKL